MLLREGTTGRDLVVDTDTGAVRGIRRREVRMWRGIPYAASTAGDGRFRSPRPVAGWHGIREAYSVGSSGEYPRQDGGRRMFREVGRRMQRCWTSFAASGVPDPTWPRYDEAERATLNFDGVDRVELDPRREKHLARQEFVPHV